MLDNITLLIIGDIAAKIGRKTLATVLPQWREQYRPDAVIANVENIAHGVGVTKRSLMEVATSGLNIGTGGNHIWDKDSPIDPELQSILPIALPANDPRTPERFRWQSIAIGSEKLFVVNLLGQFEMGIDGLASPFTTFDTLYETMGKPLFLVIDMHAEATSEKVALGHYADGRASVVVGTHTHIPTADTRILTKGTGYQTDLGMTGADDSVLGVQKDIVLRRFLNLAKDPFEAPEKGPAWICGVLATLDRTTGKCIEIKQLQEQITIN